MKSNSRLLLRKSGAAFAERKATMIFAPIVRGNWALHESRSHG